MRKLPAYELPDGPMVYSQSPAVEMCEREGQGRRHEGGEKEAAVDGTPAWGLGLHLALSALIPLDLFSKFLPSCTTAAAT